MASKIHIGDEVIIITGKDKGKKGKIISFLDKNKVIVKGINLVKKHKKSISFKNKNIGIIEKESWIHKSNIAIFNLETKMIDNVDFILEKNKKIRIFRSNKKIIK